jgi:hypothetical protein
MISYLDNPQLWRSRAEEARVLAEEMSDRDCYRIMLSIAESYEEMARRAEERLGIRPHGRQD